MSSSSITILERFYTLNKLLQVRWGTRVRLNL